MHDNPELIEKIKKVLSRMNVEIDPNAIIAGGAALHLETGAPFSDVDVYYTKNKKITKAKISKFIKSLESGPAPGSARTFMGIDWTAPPYSDTSPGVSRQQPTEENEYEVVEGTKVISSVTIDGTKFQFMEIDKETPLNQIDFAKKVIDGFDIGICRVATYLKDDNLVGYVSEDHTKDIVNKTLSLKIGYNNDQDRKTLTSRLPKYLKKFPKFKVRMNIKKKVKSVYSSPEYQYVSSGSGLYARMPVGITQGGYGWTPPTPAPTHVPQSVVLAAAFDIETYGRELAILNEQIAQNQASMAVPRLLVPDGEE